jgi:hypothetical protein
MAVITETKRVNEITVGELKGVIRETMQELYDPDYGMELAPEVEKELMESLVSPQRIPASEVAKGLGLNW